MPDSFSYMGGHDISHARKLDRRPCVFGKQMTVQDLYHVHISVARASCHVDKVSSLRAWNGGRPSSVGEANVEANEDLLKFLTNLRISQNISNSIHTLCSRKVFKLQQDILSSDFKSKSILLVLLVVAICLLLSYSLSFDPKLPLLIPQSKRRLKIAYLIIKEEICARFRTLRKLRRDSHPPPIRKQRRPLITSVKRTNILFDQEYGRQL